MFKTCLALTLLLFFSGFALASPIQDDRYFASQARDIAKPHPAVYAKIKSAKAERASGHVIGGRPSGCPWRYCGCGASIEVFGRIIPALNLAANWLRMFPRAHPAPGMVAARRGHVFVLKQHLVGSTWIVHDSNSGGHKTRLHARSISGYVVVNPRG